MGSIGVRIAKRVVFFNVNGVKRAKLTILLLLLNLLVFEEHEHVINMLVEVDLERKRPFGALDQLRLFHLQFYRDLSECAFEEASFIPRRFSNVFDDCFALLKI